MNAAAAMRALLSCGWLAALSGCVTVQTGRTLLGVEPGPLRCTTPTYVAFASPLTYPEVQIDVVAERDCRREFRETYETHQEMRVRREVNTIVAAGLGAAAGVGAVVALQRYYQPSGQPQPFDPRTYGSYRVGDAWLIVPLVGALAGAGLVAALGGNTPSQTLPVERETHSRFEETHPTAMDIEGTLRLQDGTAVAQLRGGRARLRLSSTNRAWVAGLWLDGNRVDWSMRASAWQIDALPECDRASKAANGHGIETMGFAALVQLERDAAVCARAGWAFADDLLHRIDRTCQRRFSAPCGSLVDK